MALQLNLICNKLFIGDPQLFLFCYNSCDSDTQLAAFVYGSHNCISIKAFLHATETQLFISRNSLSAICYSC